MRHQSEEFNPIIKENQIFPLKTEDGKVPQVDMLSAETMAKLFEWHNASRAKFKAHSMVHLKTASMCDDIEIPIVVIDGNETTAFIRRSNGNSSDAVNWQNYPKVADIEVNTRHGFKQTLEEIFAEISRFKPSNAPVNRRPVATMVQGGQNVNEPQPVVDPLDKNSVNVNENKIDEQQPIAHTPCTSSLCNGQQINDRSNFPLFNFFNSFLK